MSAITLFPSLFFRIVEPRLADWDERLARDDERALLGKPRRAAPDTGRTGVDVEAATQRRAASRPAAGEAPA